MSQTVSDSQTPGIAAAASLPAGLAAALLLAAALVTPPPALAAGCQESARLARRACKFDVKDNLFERRAICAQVSDPDAREECLDDADDERDEEAGECAAVHAARLAFCAASGEDFYDPPFSQGMFTKNFDDSNPFWPLTPGHHWEYESQSEVIVVEVLSATKRVRKGRVDCIVVHDVVADEDGELIEDTDDWYALAHDGTVYYCGENAKDYEYFKGDDPQEAELVAIDGSFKHGVEGAKAGIAMMANPAPGDIYRQEFSLGEAEDGAEVLSTTYGFGNGSGLDAKVPSGLANLFCNGDCLVTREFNLNEPGVEARKYYAPGVGLFLEVEGNEVVRLVACNFDSRCDSL